MLTLDGSTGEGGGQILRSALALSVITGRPFRITNIRANRDRPGLRRQHLTAVRAAAAISRATVEGDAIDSRELSFTPGPVVPGEYTFDIGSAGSATLVLQTVLPPLIVSDVSSMLTLHGGTHNPGGPPMDFLEKSFLPVINRMGAKVEVVMQRPGFAPRGGGRFTVSIDPPSGRKIRPVDILQRGAIRRRKARAVVAAIPRGVAERELGVVAKRLGWATHEQEAVELPVEFGPGNVITLEVEGESVTEVFTGIGQRGIRAEAVAEQAVAEAERYLAGPDVPVGDCLADQLLLPFALAGGGSYRTLALTRHSATNIGTIRTFLPTQVLTTEEPGGAVRVEVRAAG
jgi:RNA 3'-terminal phosphate cyclase (ATP)